MNTAIQTQTQTQALTQAAARTTLPAQGLNLGAAALSLVVTSALLGAVVFGMGAMADRPAPMSASSSAVQAG